MAKGPQPRWLATGLHLHARLSFIVRTYRGAPYKARPPVRLSACQREGYCQRQMDVQWGNTCCIQPGIRRMPTCPQLRKRRLRGLPFVLTRGRALCPSAAGGRMRARHLHFFCAVGRGKHTPTNSSENGEAFCVTPFSLAFLSPPLPFLSSIKMKWKWKWKWMRMVFFFLFSFFSFVPGCSGTFESFSFLLPLSYRDIKKNRRKGENAGFWNSFQNRCLSRVDTREIKKPWSSSQRILKILDRVTGWSHRVSRLTDSFLILQHPNGRFLDRIFNRVVLITLFLN